MMINFIYGISVTEERFCYCLCNKKYFFPHLFMIFATLLIFKSCILYSLKINLSLLLLLENEISSKTHMYKQLRKSLIKILTMLLLTVLHVYNCWSRLKMSIIAVSTIVLCILMSWLPFYYDIVTLIPT